MPNSTTFAEGDSIESTSPPSDFEHCGLDTPKPPKIKFRSRTPFLTKILNRGSSEAKKMSPAQEPVEQPPMEPAVDQRVSFQLEVETIPVKNHIAYYTESDEYEGVESSNVEDNDRDEEEFADVLSEAEDSNDINSGYVAADEADETITATSSPSFSSMIKNFVFVDIGPNISDTVREFTNLLVDAATRTKSDSVGFSEE